MTSTPNTVPRWIAAAIAASFMAAMTINTSVAIFLHQSQKQYTKDHMNIPHHPGAMARETIHVIQVSIKDNFDRTERSIESLRAAVESTRGMVSRLSRSKHGDFDTPMPGRTPR